MIVNKSITGTLYRCNKTIARYLILAGVPPISYDNRYYYFVDTELLRTSLESMPLHLKVLDKLLKKEGGKM